MKRLLQTTVLISVAAFCPSVYSQIIVNLTTPGSQGSVNGALFKQIDVMPTGTGVIQSFVRIQASPTEKGYNTDGTPEFDTKGGAFTHSITLADVPLVTIDSVQYREFLLDIDENRPGKFLSLDELQIYFEPEPDLDSFPADFSNLVYDLDDGGDNWIKLNYALGSGSGSGDMLAYIPDSLFTGPGPYVYLYSQFGLNKPADNGPEEWAVRTIIPTPAAVVLAGLGIFLAGRLRRQKPG